MEKRNPFKLIKKIKIITNKINENKYPKRELDLLFFYLFILNLFLFN